MLSETDVLPLSCCMETWSHTQLAFVVFTVVVVVAAAFVVVVFVKTEETVDGVE